MNKDQNLKNFSSEVKENFGNTFELKQIEDFTKLDKKSMSKKIITFFETKRKFYRNNN